MAKAFWPHAEWIQGSGMYALLAHCDVLTVPLWPSLEEAEASKQFIDKYGYGHACNAHWKPEQHEIVRLPRLRAINSPYAPGLIHIADTAEEKPASKRGLRSVAEPLRPHEPWHADMVHRRELLRGEIVA